MTAESFPFLIVQLFNIIFPIGWLLLAVLALLGLSKRRLPPVALAIWVAVILLVPWLGAIAYWLIKPGEEKRG